MKHLIAAGVVAACASSTPPSPTPATKIESSMNHEDPVVTKLRAALAAQVAFDALEERVGQPSLARTPDVALAIVRRAIVEDPEHPGEALRIDASTAAVIYWERPTTDRNPHVVGVQLQQDGSRRMFFGVIPPP